MPGLSFERVADHYDATRGGTRRGDHVADALASWVVGPRVVEVGIGTGVVAAGLRRHGFAVAGVDLSEAMLRAALDRVGGAVARADADALPVPAAAIDTLYFVWVLHLVDDPVATLREAARVVRPGGRVIAVAARPETHPDDEIGTAMAGLPAPARSDDSLGDLAPSDLQLDHHGDLPWNDFEGTPAQQIEMIERRSYSSLFDMDDATWANDVQPVIDLLRALPDPDRPRLRRNRHPVYVWRRR